MKSLVKYSLLVFSVLFLFLLTTRNSYAYVGLNPDQCPSSANYVPDPQTIEPGTQFEVTLTPPTNPPTITNPKYFIALDSLTDQFEINLVTPDWKFDMPATNPLSGKPLSRGSHFFRLIINSAGAGGGEVYRCLIPVFTFSIGLPAPVIDCPSNPKVEPTGKITVESEVKVYWDPPSSGGDYLEYHGYMDSETDPTMTFDLDADWDAQIHPPQLLGNHYLQLQYYWPGSDKTDCGNRISLQVVNLGAPGSNPCELVGEKYICTTAIGPIAADPKEFVASILTIALGLAGGIALIFMVIGSIKVLTSSGDQQKLNTGKDQIVAAIAGLLFLILSVLILKFIGITLALPFV